jgi:hypothetical protein
MTDALNTVPQTPIQLTLVDDELKTRRAERAAIVAAVASALVGAEVSHGGKHRADQIASRAVEIADECLLHMDAKK